MSYGKWVANDKVVGGTVTACETWGAIRVLGTDGLEYEIEAVEGRSGVEYEVRETASSVAKRGAATRKGNNA